MGNRVEVNQWTVIFLVDQNPLNEIVLLRRAPDKSFAPNWYTGIGGKVGDLPGLENETPLEAAYRELEEETEGELHARNILLTEFANCCYDSGLRLHYFWGIYPQNQPPHISPTDGALSWVSRKSLLNRDIIPTTQAVCQEWSRRDFLLNQPFTVFVREVGQDRGVRLVDVIRTSDGLTPVNL